MVMPLLELHGVDYVYPDGSAGLRNCSLRLRRGLRHALLGANGAGKTTLLQHLNGLLRPDAGVVCRDGQPFDYGRAGLAAVRRQVGLVFQNPDRQLFSAVVEEDVSFGPLNLGLDEPSVRLRVASALDAVGMRAYARHPVHHLSFGQKKRVCIAGVLAMESDVLLLDEPMAGLDIAMQVELAALLDDLQQRGVTIVLSTHDMDFAFRWADEIHLMAGGACIGSGPTLDLAARADLLHAAGQRPPLALSLHAALAERGLMPGQPVPRSIEAVLDALRVSPGLNSRGEHA
jgi:cobalt/nickel transport system ATP-binding protein